MSKIALIIFLLIIIIYVLSYLRFNFQHFQASSISDEQLELALSFFDGLKLENNEFTLYDKPIKNQISGVFRLGMWKFEDFVNNKTTYLNFLSNGKVHSFDTKESDNLSTNTFEVSPSAATVTTNYEGEQYEFEKMNNEKYKLVGSNDIILTKMTEFTVKTICSARQGINCEYVGKQKSLFYLNDIQYKIKYTNKISNTNYDNFGSEESISDFNGMHILVLNKNGSIHDFQHFDIWYYADEYLNAKDYLKQIPPGKIVAVNTYMGIADLGYPKIILVTTGGTHKAVYSLNEKNSSFIDLTNPIEESNLIVENNNQNISKVLMSPGIELSLFADKLPNELNYNSIGVDTNDINVKSNDLYGIDPDHKFKIYNIPANKQKNFKTMKVSYDFTGEDKYNLAMKTLRNPIEGLMKIGSDYNLILNVGDSYSIIGIKDEPIGNATETKISPYVKDNCPGQFKNKVIAISEGFDTSISRDFTLHAYKPIKTTFKVDVFSKGLVVNKYHGFSAFYLNDNYINLQTGSRGINMLVLNEDGTNHSFNSYDTHPRNYLTTSPLEKFLNDYEELPEGSIVCLSFADSTVNGAMQFAYLYQNNSHFGTLAYIPYQQEASDGSFTLNGQYTLLWDNGFNLANVPSYIGQVLEQYTTDQVSLSPRTKLEIYGGGNFEQDDKTTITYSQMSGVNNRYTLPNPKEINSAILVPDRDNYEFVDIFDVIKDIGGSPNQSLNYRCDFAIIGKKGAPPNTAAYQYNEGVGKTNEHGLATVSSPRNKIAHASREFDL